MGLFFNDDHSANQLNSKNIENRQLRERIQYLESQLHPQSYEEEKIQHNLFDVLLMSGLSIGVKILLFDVVFYLMTLFSSQSISPLFAKEFMRIGIGCVLLGLLGEGLINLQAWSDKRNKNR